MKISTVSAAGVLALGTYACGSGAKKPVEQAAEVVKSATGMGLGLQLYSIRDAIVITSYSIHYTKLYESLPEQVWGVLWEVYMLPDT